MFYLDYVYIENPEGESLTSMMVCAGRTLTGTTVRRRTLKKKMETLRRGVSDRHDGYVGHTVVGTTVCHMCPLKNTWEKNERPFETGSLSRMTVVQDRPLRVRRSVTCVRWGTLGKKIRDP